MMRGFTLLETMISLAVFAVLMGSIGAGLVQDSNAHATIVAAVGPEMKVRRVLHRIGKDLRMAGVWGEDRNHNGRLDDDEDLNDNGVLDADWNLEDKTERADLAFNTRMDLRDKDGTVITTGVYDGKTRYLFEDNTVLREKTRYDEDGKATVVRTVLATRVKELRFARSGGLVRIRASVDIASGGGRSREYVLETRVWLRN